MTEVGDAHLLVNSVEDIQGNRSDRVRGMFSRFRISRGGDGGGDGSRSATAGSVLLSLAVIGTAFLLSLSATLFANTAPQHATVYGLALVTLDIVAIVGILALAVAKTCGFHLGESGAWAVCKTGVSSGLVLGVGILGVSWANTPSDQHTVTDSRNYFTLIALVFTVFIGRQAFARKFAGPQSGGGAGMFGVELSVTCALAASLFLAGEVGEFDLQSRNNATSDAGYVVTGETDLAWSALAAASLVLVGVGLLLWEAALRQQVHWLYVITVSSITSVFPILVSLAVRYSVWYTNDNGGGSAGVEGAFSCLAGSGGCGAVATAGCWLFLLTSVSVAWLYPYYVSAAGGHGSVSLLARVVTGLLLGAFLFTTVMDKSGAYAAAFDAASVFMAIALLATCSTYVMHACAGHEQHDQL